MPTPLKKGAVSRIDEPRGEFSCEHCGINPAEYYVDLDEETAELCWLCSSAEWMQTDESCEEEA